MVFIKEAANEHTENNGLTIANIFQNLPANLDQEYFEDLFQNANLTIERIISKGHSTAENHWYDQEQDEWVILLQGKATLRFKNEEKLVILNPGDYLLIPAHRQHRVEWTDPKSESIWLAFHFRNDAQLVSTSLA